MSRRPLAWKSLGRLGLCAGVLAPGGPAFAIDVELCARYAVDYADADAAVGDDYLTDNDEVLASGVRIQVVRNSDSAIVFDGNADDGGADDGCVAVTGLTTTNYSVVVLSTAQVAGNTLKVWNNDSSNALHAWVDPFWVPPLGGGTETFTTSLHDPWRILATATHALHRSDAGLSGENLVFYTQECSGGGSCLGANGRVYLCPSAACSNNPHNKYLVGHEMGHLVFFLGNGKDFTSFSYAYTPGTCDSDGGSGHRINSEEYQGAAANEGIAHFWAAFAFNDDTESNCGFDYYASSVDWDYNTSGDDDRISCEGSPDPSGAPTVDGADYHGDVCGGTADKGVEYDWLRLGWDLVSDESIPMEDIVEIWDLADPDAWNTNGSGVAEAMSDAADTVGWGAEYDYWADFNGTDR